MSCGSFVLSPPKEARTVDKRRPTGCGFYLCTDSLNLEEVPSWVRPHQYWWRRTHDLVPPCPQPLVAAKGKGAAAKLCVSTCVSVRSTIRSARTEVRGHTCVDNPSTHPSLRSERVPLPAALGCGQGQGDGRRHALARVLKEELGLECTIQNRELPTFGEFPPSPPWGPLPLCTRWGARALAAKTRPNS